MIRRNDEVEHFIHCRTGAPERFAIGGEPNPKNVVVFQQEGRFGGWPANHGIWSWGDEILVGFEVGYFRASERGHSIDYSRPAEHVLARSLDGGETWKIEKPEGLRPPPGEKVAGVPTGETGKPLQDCQGGMDFSNPELHPHGSHDQHQRWRVALLLFDGSRKIMGRSVPPSGFRAAGYCGPHRLSDQRQARHDHVPHRGQVQSQGRTRHLRSYEGRRQDVELRFVRHAGAGRGRIRDHAGVRPAGWQDHPDVCPLPQVHRQLSSRRTTAQRGSASASLRPRRAAIRRAW